MDPNTFSYLVNQKTLHSAYYQHKDEDCMIDLGLSLRALQPESFDHPSLRGDYVDHLLDWHELYPEKMKQFEDETKSVQSKERWGSVKVNMDGVIVGRKICIHDHMNYSTLAFQLEDMFGGQTVSGLRLFQDGSEFSLIFKDKGEIWRSTGDAPWKEFVESAKRLRIVPKDETPLPFP